MRLHNTGGYPISLITAQAAQTIQEDVSEQQRNEQSSLTTAHASTWSSHKNTRAAITSHEAQKHQLPQPASHI